MLPLETSVRQLKKLRAETKGTDIGDLTTKDRLNMPVPNMQAIGNPVDTGIESWEEFSNKDSKLQTIAFKSKLVNKPLVKENKKEKTNMKQDIKKFEDFEFAEGEEKEDLLKQQKKSEYEYNLKNPGHEYEREDYLDDDDDEEDFVQEDDLNDDDRQYIIDLIYNNTRGLLSPEFDRKNLEHMSDEELDQLLNDLKLDSNESIKTFEAFSVPAAKTEEKQPEYTILGKEKEPKSNPNFGIGAVKSEEIKTIGSFTDFTKLIDPVTPKERTIGGNAGVFVDNDTVKGYVNRIDGKDVYVESLDEPMIIKKFNIKDVVKTSKEK